MTSQLVRRGDQLVRLSNASIRGLGRPAVLAMHWLYEVSATLIDAFDHSDDVGHLVGLEAIRKLRLAVSQDVVAAQAVLDAEDDD